MIYDSIGILTLVLVALAINTYASLRSLQEMRIGPDDRFRIKGNLVVDLVLNFAGGALLGAVLISLEGVQ